MEKEIYGIPTPPRIVYADNDISSEQQDPTRRVFKEAEKQPLFTIVGLELPEEKDGGGMFIHYKELKYPRKGFPYPEAVYAINYAKKQMSSWLKFFVQKELILSYLAFILIPWSKKVKVISTFLEGYYDSIYLILSPHFLLPRYYMAPAKELGKYTELFLRNLGVVPEIAKHCGSVITMIIEYDSAYCWRIQDIFTEANRENLLKNPAKELTRLLNILQEREKMSKKVKKHFHRIATLLRFALKIGRIKKAFIQATQEIDLTKIAFTEADKYHVMFYAGYDFLGKTSEEKEEILKNLHGGVIPVGSCNVKVG